MVEDPRNAINANVHRHAVAESQSFWVQHLERAAAGQCHHEWLKGNPPGKGAQTTVKSVDFHGLMIIQPHRPVQPGRRPRGGTLLPASNGSY